MADKFEKLLKIIYGRWKKDCTNTKGAHPDEESVACFLDNKLSQQESEAIKKHILECVLCAQRLSLGLRISEAADKQVSSEVLAKVSDLVNGVDSLAVYLRLKDRIFEVLSVAGDILVGRSSVAQPALRSPKGGSFKNEIVISKSFADIKVQIKIESKGKRVFSITVFMRANTSRVLQDGIRVALLKDNTELESYLARNAKVVFEDVPLGRYTVEISTADKKNPSILIDIRE